MLKKSTVITLAASIALIVMGIIKAQYTDVFVKAVKVCLECIGIG